MANMSRVLIFVVVSLVDIWLCYDEKQNLRINTSLWSLYSMTINTVGNINISLLYNALSFMLLQRKHVPNWDLTYFLSYLMLSVTLHFVLKCCRHRFCAAEGADWLLSNL